MNSPWDAQQREWLQALGYDLMVPVANATPPDTSPATASDAAGSVPVAAASAAPDDRLVRALARAARCEAGALAALQLDLEGLRRDPAAKRAAWPCLRALRRGAR